MTDFIKLYGLESLFHFYSHWGVNFDDNSHLKVN